MATPQANVPLRAQPSFWRIGDWRLFPKLWLASIAVVVLCLSISGYVSISSSRDALLAQGTLNLKGSSSHTSDAIDAYLRANRNAIAAASALPDTVSFATNPNSSTAKASALSTLRKVKTQFDYESIVMINTQGTIILDTADESVNTNVSYAPYFREAMNGVVGYISDPSVSIVTKRPVLFFSAPIFDPAGAILAVIASRESLSKISTIVEKDWGVAGAGTFGVLLDQNGIRLAHSYSSANPDQVAKTLLFSAVAPVPAATVKQLVAEKRFGDAPRETVPVVPMPEVAAAMRNPQIKTFESSADISEVRHYASITALTVKPWYYVIMTPLPVFTKSADDLVARYLLILAIVAMLISIGAFFFARAITQPIAYLTQMADRISLGELDIAIGINRKDEIGELAEAFERMRASMQIAIERLRARRS